MTENDMSLTTACLIALCAAAIGFILGYIVGYNEGERDGFSDGYATCDKDASW